MINNTQLESSNIVNDLDINARKEIEQTQVEQDRNQFLELMIAQLENQNPLEPQDGGEFLAQLAQFSTVEGIENLNDSMSDLASGFRSGQALQATSLVGRSVDVPQNFAEIQANQGLSGSIEVPYSTSELTVRFTNEAGELVKEMKLGSQSSGQVGFDWNGLDETGAPVSEGFYFVEATAKQNGEDLALNTFLSRNVSSVTLDQLGNVTVNVEGVGSVPLSDVRAIQ